MIENELLLAEEDFEPYKSMFANWDFDGEIAPKLREAQELDLKPMLGAGLYYDLVKNRAEQKYIDLLNGKEYVLTTDTIFFNGIRPALVYFAHAKFTRFANVKGTASGFVQKNTPESTHVSEKTIAGMIAQSQSAAISFMNDVVKFLDKNRTDYPLWKSGLLARKKSGIKITPIGGTSTDQLGENGKECCGELDKNDL